DVHALGRRIQIGYAATEKLSRVQLRTAFWGVGGNGSVCIRLGLYAAGEAGGQVRRRLKPNQDAQEQCRRRPSDGAWHAGVLQRTGEGNPLPGYRYGTGNRLSAALKARLDVE